VFRSCGVAKESPDVHFVFRNSAAGLIDPAALARVARIGGFFPPLHTRHCLVRPFTKSLPRWIPAPPQTQTHS
jgi:hypothetical protein